VVEIGPGEELHAARVVRTELAGGVLHREVPADLHVVDQHRGVGQHRPRVDPFESQRHGKTGAPNTDVEQ